MPAPTSKPVHAVQVRELVAFVLRRGDLGGGELFVGTDRARLGIQGHQMIQRSRPPGYQTEIPVEQTLETDEFILHIRGRIDGVLAVEGKVLLEEIKTVQGTWDGRIDPLHWAQAKIYGCIYAAKHALEHLAIRLTHLELATGRVTEACESFSFTELSAFFDATAAVYLEWLHEEHEWRRVRDRSIGTLPFPFPAYRPGQRDLAVAAYRVLAGGGRLFLAAPTGIGKTISVIFPALKALGEGRLARLFYLTARTVGRAVAEQALVDLRRAGLKLRSVTLTAREKICVQAGAPCDPQTCPLALGYYDRLKPAMREALAREEITRPVIEAVGREHQVCPFELALDLSVWADAVICDYNYLFDPRVYLRRHFAEPGGDFGFLVDEAHNLVDRAREMFSADLDGQELHAVRRAIQHAVPRCARALAKLNAEMRRLAGSALEVREPVPASDPSVELDLFPDQAAGPGEPANRAREGTPAAGSGDAGVATCREFPSPLTELLETALTETESWLARNQPAAFREDLLALFFRLHSFRRTAELYDERYVTIIQDGAAAKVRLFCLDPSVLLRQALARGKAAIFFSATLTPIDYYRNLLGGAADDPFLPLPSPFPPENLDVLVHDRIQTRFKARAESLGEVVAATGALIGGRRGNYLVYFPSFQYLNAVLKEFQHCHPSVQVLSQRPGMTEAEREAFLAAFSVEHGETLAGFVVLGGIFGEGIDLIGERLIGAVIVGVGLPQLCVERDLIRDHFQEQNGAGFDYAYTFPGMNRVLQAVGRVIRSETDRGAVLLVDARFNESRYRRLFPAWWRTVRVRNSGQLREAVERFWSPHSQPALITLSPRRSRDGT